MKRHLLFVALLSVVFTLSLRADTVVVFNEIMYHPAQDETNMEWLELRNQMAVDVDISGWSLAGAVHYTFPSNSIVPGGGYAVVAISPSTLRAATGLTNIYGPFLGRLGNNGDHIELSNISGRPMDEIDYGTDGDWPVAPDGSGVSLAKLDRDSASGPAENWAASAEMGGTPGRDNFPTYNYTGPDVELVALDASWRFNDTGNDLGTAWREPSYDDQGWATGRVLTNRPVETVFNTGVNSNGVVVAPAGSDPHYILSANAQGTVGINATVIQNHASWLANDANSSWIGVVNPGTANVNAGAYYYQMRFSLAGFIPSTVQLNYIMCVDNDVTNIFLNGTPTGGNFSGFNTWSGTNTLSSGFVTGTNTLEFRTVNAGTSANPHGFRAQVNGTGVAVNTNTVIASTHTTSYFRKSFVFDGDPANAKFKLQTVVSGGAVVYLNGVEIYRLNMPAGAVDASTAAVTNVTVPISCVVSIPASSLVNGTNVLAVEMHQAAGVTNPIVVGEELSYTPLPTPAFPIAFNEIAASTNNEFWLELINYGTREALLDGCKVYADSGSTNYSYTFPSNHLALPPGGLLTVTESMLGFKAGSGDRLYLLPPVAANVIDAVVVKKTLKGRYPDGTGKWLWPDPATPGASNSFSFHNEIVINEIMYQHARLASDGPVPTVSLEQWLELFNRSTNAVDLGGWQLDGGVRYTFTNGTVMQAGEYLVLTKDPTTLQRSYPGISILGPYNGNLSRKSDLIVLKDPTGNPVNQVRYFDSSPWPDYANGGSSSLELRDPYADNSRPEAWAASDESGKASWLTVDYTMAAWSTNSGQPTQWSDFILGLLGEGECLVDDLKVLDLTTGSATLIGNGDFETNTGWRIIGTHTRSRIEVDPENPGNHVLHIRASGPQEHMHNHIETTLLNGVTIVNGHNYEISYRAKWVAGNNFLNTRLYFNRSARTTSLPRPSQNGTPGARNSRYESNIGPTFSGLRHSPVIPQPGEPVTVSVFAQDPQGVSSCELWWSVSDGGWNSVPMTNAGGGSLYTGTIPGYPSWSLIQFYVQGVDSLGVVGRWPAAGADSGALYAVADGQANLSLGHNVRIILTPSNTALLHAFTNVQSNDRLPCTIVYDEKRAYYNSEVRLRSSERGRYSDIRTTWHIVFPSDDPFRGTHPCMIMHRSGTGDSTANKQFEIVCRHLVNRSKDIPGTYADLSRVIAPKSIHTGPVMFAPRHKDQFIETAYANGQDGIVWKFELIYYPTTANTDGYKNPNPDNVIGTDISDLGNNKEIYRYNFILKNHRDADDWTQLMAFAKAFSLNGEQLDQATRQVMDVDEWMRSYALLSLCGIGDTYTYGNNHNLILYQRPSDKKMLGFLWDMSFAFNRATGASLVGDQNLSKIINRPCNLRLYYGHMLNLIDTTYNASYMDYWVRHYMKFCPGQDFTSALSYIQARGDYARSVIVGAGGTANFAVNGPNTIVTNGNMLTLTGVAPVTAKRITLNGMEYPLSWASINTWNLTLPVNAASNVLNLQCYDYSGNLMSNQSAVVTVVNTGQVVPAQGTVVFNEIMYNPSVTNASYLELYNTSSNFIFDISGWRINGLGDYTFPGGSYLSNQQCLVLVKDREAFTNTYGSEIPVFDTFSHKLDKDGETLTLLIPAATTNDTDTIVDKVRYEAVPPWASTENGTSLQLIDAAQDNARVGNWTAGALWHFFSATTNAGSILDRTLYIYPPFSAVDVYLDDIQLYTGTAAAHSTNVLRNGDFETGTPYGWSLKGGTNSIFVTNTASHSGNYSIRLSGTNFGNPSSSGISQALTSFVANTNYTLSYWYLPNFKGSTLIGRISFVGAKFYATNNNLYAVQYTPGVANSVTSILPAFAPLWLNEVQAQNLNTRTNRLGEYAPWVELYNAGPAQESLAGYYLANNYTNLTQWAFPSDATIEPGEFKVIWLDGAESNSTLAELHASFTIPQSTGSVALVRIVDSAPQVVDYLNYSGLGASLSYGDYPDGQPFSRQIFFNVTPGGTNDAQQGVLSINEWMASNVPDGGNGLPGFPDPADQDYDDWFELYNPNAFEVNLAGFYLTDAATNPTQFRIPSGYIVPAHGYFIVWADGETGQNRSTNRDLHVNFQLSKGGEQIGLYDQNTNQIDLVEFGPQTNNISQGRFGDGAKPPYYFMSRATPGAANIVTVNTAPVLAPVADQVITLGQTLIITNVFTDAEAAFQSFTWHVDGAPLGAMIDTNGVFTWTPMPAQAPSTNQMTVWVEDNGVPRLSASASFTVRVTTVEFRLSITNDNSTLSIACQAIPGKRYRVEYCDGLGAGAVWEVVPGYENVSATDGKLLIPLTIGTNTSRFYRIVQLP